MPAITRHYLKNRHTINITNDDGKLSVCRHGFKILEDSFVHYEHYDFNFDGFIALGCARVFLR
ncbi:Uncharacterized protein XB17_02780 [Leptospira santarosai]|nr:Uncharacterized protein XB17_02780 [Leptospira santarosai]AVV79528.1 Uncharacterized protein XB15_01754 [Leptospira santarosai]